MAKTCKWRLTLTPLPRYINATTPYGYAPVYKCVREDSAVVRVSRSSHAHVPSEGIVPKYGSESLRPAGRIDDSVVVNLVEVVTTILVGMRYKLAHYLRGRVLQVRKGEAPTRQSDRSMRRRSAI